MRVVPASAAFAVLLISVLAFPTGQAQTADALYVSADVARSASASDCQAMPYYALTSTEPPAGKAYAAMSTPVLSCPWGLEYTVAQDFTMQDGASASLRFSCDTVVVGASFEGATRSIAFTLRKNAEAISTASWVGTITCNQGSGAFTADVELGGAGTAFAAGDVLGVHMSVFAGPTPPPGTQGNLYIEAGTTSYVTVPGLPGAATEPEPQMAQQHFEELAGPLVNHTFANATSDTYVLNFTTELVNSTAQFAWNATAGSVNVTLMDPDHTVVFDGRFEGNGSLAHVIQNATAGPWNLTLAYAGFNGTFRFEMSAPTEDPVTDTDNGSAPTEEAEGNGTADPDDTKEADTPLPLLVPLAGLALAAGSRRRMAQE